MTRRGETLRARGFSRARKFSSGRMAEGHRAAFREAARPTRGARSSGVAGWRLLATGPARVAVAAFHHGRSLSSGSKRGRGWLKILPDDAWERAPRSTSRGLPRRPRSTATSFGAVQGRPSRLDLGHRERDRTSESFQPPRYPVRPPTVAHPCGVTRTSVPVRSGLKSISTRLAGALFRGSASDEAARRIDLEERSPDPRAFSHLEMEHAVSDGWTLASAPPRRAAPGR